MKDIKATLVTKICNTCLRDLPRSEFNHREASKDKLQPYCKLCTPIKVNDWHNSKRKQEELNLRAERGQLTLFEIK